MLHLLKVSLLLGEHLSSQQHAVAISFCGLVKGTTLVEIANQLSSLVDGLEQHRILLIIHTKYLWPCNTESYKLASCVYVNRVESYNTIIQ